MKERRYRKELAATNREVATSKGASCSGPTDLSKAAPAPLLQYTVGRGQTDDVIKNALLQWRAKYSNGLVS